MKKLIIIPFFLVILNLYSQINTPNLIPDVFPPSPEASSIGKFGEIPVSYYTGVPNISIPLFSLKSKMLPINVSLSYHAGGAKVEDQASSVGLGWSMYAGGSISRTVRGLPDESSAGFLNSTYSLAEVENNPVVAELAARGEIDTQPDIFQFNFNGKSGKMFYDKNGNLHLQPKQNLVITKISTGWKIITDTGDEYLFEAIETQEAQTFCTSGIGIPFQNPTPSYISSWYLTKITSSDKKDIITFEYTTPTIVEYPITSYSSRNYKTGGSDNDSKNYTSYCASTLKINSIYLKKITFLNGSMYFNYQSRLDLSNASRLARIGLYDESNNQIKEYVFNQDYFNYSNDFKKLSLSSIKEQKSSFNPIGINDIITTYSENPPHVFEYFPKSSNPTNIRNSQDLWGFYNGRDNKDLLPTSLVPIGNPTPIIFGADRSPNLESARTYTLKKIQYPTGGFTEFEYDLNEVINDNIDYPNKFTATTHQISDNSNTPKTFVINSYGSSLGGIPVEITLTTPACTGTPIGSLPCSTGEEVACTQLVTGCPVVVKIQKCTSVLSGNCIGWTDVATYAGYYSNYKHSILLSDGQYRITTQNPTGSSVFFAGVKYYEKDVKFGAGGVVLPNKKVGGLRIKSILSFSSPSDLNPIIKNYNYDNNIGETNGRLTSLPILTNTLRSSRAGTTINGACLEYQTQYFVINAFSNASMGTTQGSYVGYSQVREQALGNGKTNHTFTSVQDAGFNDINNMTFPFGPPTSRDYKRGLLLKSDTYSEQNSQLLSQEKKYKFDTNNYFEVRGIKVGSNISGDLCRNRTMLDYSIATFYEISDWFYNNENIETTIHTTGDFVTKQSNLYDENYLQLKQVITERSDQTSYTTDFKYPYDFLSLTPYQDMVNANIIAPVIEKTVKVGGQTQSVEKTHYQKYHSSFFKPSSVEVSQRGGPLVTKVTFDNYDTQGNLLAYTPQNGLATSLTYWDGQINGEGKKGLVKTKTVADQTINYDYFPLIGLKTQTDPNGRTMTYEYDSFTRLKKIFDYQNRLLKEFCYHYNGQALDCTLGTFSGVITPPSKQLFPDLPGGREFPNEFNEDFH